MPLRNLTTLLIASVVSLLCYSEAGRNRFSSTMSDAIDTISQNYVKDVDPRTLFEGGLDGMLQELDPYSGYIRPEEFKQFNDEMRQNFGGIGIEVGIRDDRLTVLSPLPGTPAYDAGLLSGDQILAVDGTSTIDVSMIDAVKLIQGEAGTSVVLTILHAGAQETEDISVKRAIISVESIRGDRRTVTGDWIYRLESHPNIGYVRLLKFAQKTAEELRATLNSLDGKVDGLIIDLRGNPGGLLDAAVMICDMFVEKQLEIVSVRRRHGVLQNAFASMSDPIVDPNLPVVVLIDRYSASASEIFAACLQDHGRAQVVGERSYGKGTVQNVIPVEAGRSAIRLTTATYWRPSGRNIHRHKGDQETDEWGVSPKPEFTVELTPKQFEQVYLKRRGRDVLSPDIPSTSFDSDELFEPKGTRADEPEGASQENETPGEAEPFTDPQLDRAIEYLQKKISDEPDAPSAIAA